MSNTKEYEKTGYLRSSFRLFHICDTRQRIYEYHYHDFHKILLFLSGNVTYSIEGHSYALNPYDVVLVKAGEVHRPVINTSAAYERIILYVSDDFLKSYDCGLDLCFRKAAENHSHVLRLGAAAGKSPIFKLPVQIELSQKHEADAEEFASELYERALFLEFLIQLNRTVLHNSMDFIRTNYSNPKVLSVLEYLNEHMEEDISMDMLSTRFFTSKYHLMRLFKEETGYTIHNYLNMKRLLKARNLIASGMASTDACFTCGFKNYSTFFRAYKKYFSVSPKQEIP